MIQFIFIFDQPRIRTIFQVDNHLLTIIICTVKVRSNVDIYINRTIDLNVSLKKRMLAMENSHKYCINDIVFARCRSDPFWPAKVIKVISDHHVYQVSFFNHNTKAYIEEEDIIPFAPDTIKKQKKSILSKMREHKLLQKTRLMIIKGIDLALEQSKKLVELNESLLQKSGQCQSDHSKEKERQLTLEISFQAMKKRKRIGMDIISEQSSKRRKLNETDRLHMLNEQKEGINLQETSRDSFKEQNYSMEQAEYNLQRKFSHLCRKQRHLKKLQQKNRQQKEEIQSLRKNSDYLEHFQKSHHPSITYKHYEYNNNATQIKKYEEEVIESQNESVIFTIVKIPELEQIPTQNFKQKQQQVQIESKQKYFVEGKMQNIPIIESKIDNSIQILPKQPIALNLVTQNCAKFMIILVENQIEMVFKSNDQQLVQNQFITADFFNRDQADKDSQNQASTLQNTLLLIENTKTDNNQQQILPRTSIQHEVPFKTIESKPQIEQTKIQCDKQQGEIDFDSYLSNIVDEKNENQHQIICRPNQPHIDNLSLPLHVKQDVPQNGPIKQEINNQQQGNAIIDNNQDGFIFDQKLIQDQIDKQNQSVDKSQIIEQIVQGQKVSKMAYELESGEVLESKVQQSPSQKEQVFHQVLPEDKVEKQPPVIQISLIAQQPVYFNPFIKEQENKLDHLITQFVSKIQDGQSNVSKLEKKGDFDQHQNPLPQYELIRQEYTRQLYQKRNTNTQPQEDDINIILNVQKSQEEQVEENKQIQPMQIQQSEESFNDQQQKESLEIKINLKQVPNESEIQEEEEQLSCPQSNPVFDVLQKKLSWDEQIPNIEEMYNSQFIAPTNYPYLMAGLISLQNRITDFPQSLLVRTLKPYLERILTYLSCNQNNSQILLTMAQKQILVAIITSEKLTASTLSQQGILNKFQKIVDLYQSSSANKKNWVCNYCLEYLMVKEKLNYFTFLMRNFIVINDDDDQNYKNRTCPIYA